MYSLESPHRGDSNEYTHHAIIEYKIKKTPLNNHHLLPDLAQWLELPLSRINFHGHKDVRAIEIFIMKTRLYNIDPLKPHFYIVKLGFTGVYNISLISAQNIDWDSLEPPHRGGSNEYPQSMFWTEIWKISEFLCENFHFLVVKFSVYLNRRVFVKTVLKKYFILVLNSLSMAL